MDCDKNTLSAPDRKCSFSSDDHEISHRCETDKSLESNITSNSQPDTLEIQGEEYHVSTSLSFDESSSEDEGDDRKGMMKFGDDILSKNNLIRLYNTLDSTENEGSSNTLKIESNIDDSESYEMSSCVSFDSSLSDEEADVDRSSSTDESHASSQTGKIQGIADVVSTLDCTSEIEFDTNNAPGGSSTEDGKCSFKCSIIEDITGKKRDNHRPGSILKGEVNEAGSSDSAGSTEKKSKPRIRIDEKNNKIMHTYSAAEYERGDKTMDEQRATFEMNFEKELLEMDQFVVSLTRGESGFGFRTAGTIIPSKDGKHMNILIKTIAPGSPADLSNNIKPDDIIIELNGNSMLSVEQEQAAAVMKGCSDTITMKLARAKPKILSDEDIPDLDLDKLAESSTEE